MILNKKTERRVICPACKGTKVKSVNVFKGHTEGWYPEEEICPVCNGEGIMNQTVKIEYQIIKK